MSDLIKLFLENNERLASALLAANSDANILARKCGELFAEQEKLRKELKQVEDNRNYWLNAYQEEKNKNESILSERNFK